jgi:hypothetical protein
MSDSFPFPHPTLTPIIGKPTHLTLRLFYRQLYANARTVDSVRGGGLHGFLALVMSPEKYFALAGEVFVVPLHPGANPVHPPTATGPQITEINRVYTAALAEMVEYRKIHQLLKKQILDAIDPLFLAVLEDGAMGFADVSAAALVTHLTTKYGKLTGDAKDANTASLDLPWNPDDPLETIWTRLAAIKLIAFDAGQPIPDDLIVRKTLHVIEKTGIFDDYARRWRERPEADQTYVEFEHFFEAADEERHRRLTAQDGGFHGAHASQMLSPVLASLNIPPPAAAPTPLPPPANFALAATPITSTPSPRTQPAPSSPSTPAGGIQLFYCWTHGMGKNHAHTSSTCQRKAPGHQDTATYDNMQGGNDTLQRARPPRNPNASPRNPNANPNSRSNS